MLGNFLSLTGERCMKNIEKTVVYDRVSWCFRYLSRFVKHFLPRRQVWDPNTGCQIWYLWGGHIRSNFPMFFDHSAAGLSDLQRLDAWLRKNRFLKHRLFNKLGGAFNNRLGIYGCFCLQKLSKQKKVQFLFNKGILQQCEGNPWWNIFIYLQLCGGQIGLKFIVYAHIHRSLGGNIATSDNGKHRRWAVEPSKFLVLGWWDFSTIQPDMTDRRICHHPK